MPWIVRRVDADKIYAKTIEDALPFLAHGDAIEMQRACADADMAHQYVIEEVIR